MPSRSLLVAITAAAALTAAPLTAFAADTELLDRSAYDSTPEKTADSLRIAGATRGELGGYLDATVTATDGSLPAGSNVCEPATVAAVLTVAPGETLTVTAAGEVCTSFYGDSLVVNAYFGAKDLAYEGTAHKKAKVSGDGLIAASVNSWLGGQASFFASMKW